jgi:hypothetical protein
MYNTCCATYVLLVKVCACIISVVQLYDYSISHLVALVLTVLAVPECVMTFCVENHCLSSVQGCAQPLSQLEPAHGLHNGNCYDCATMMS